MQRDFHFYCLAVLARAAGFNSRDALNLAYASQYVDDSTEGGLTPLAIEGTDLKFDPVCTSYGGLELGRSINWSAQKRVWIPFHFLPPNPFRPQEGLAFSFVTRSGSPFAGWLIDQADSEPLQNYRRRLCRIGIALHTFADSWSHQGFSGRHDRVENDVEDIHVFRSAPQVWERLGLENVLFDLAPRIGHAEAAALPDLAFLKWKYRPGPQATAEVQRDNVEILLQAARAIYRRLGLMEKATPSDPIPWEGIEPGIHQLLAGGPVVAPKLINRVTLPTYRAYQALDVERRCERWKKKFGPLFRPYPDGIAYHYDHRQWRSEALEGDVDWQVRPAWQRPDTVARRPRTGFWDSWWVHFHRAALRQRHLVLENLP